LYCGTVLVLLNGFGNLTVLAWDWVTLFQSFHDAEAETVLRQRCEHSNIRSYGSRAESYLCGNKSVIQKA
jgi:hypothetical protein